MSNHCKFNGCINDAKKGHQFCKQHKDSVPTTTQLQASSELCSTQPPIRPSGKSVSVKSPHTREQSLVFVAVPGPESILQLQAYNKRLLDENKRLNQATADRLHFEKESRKARKNIKRLTKANEKLRAENERLQGRVTDLEGEIKGLKALVDKLTVDVKELKCDPLLIEVAQLFQLLETIVVNVISDFDGCVYISHVDIKPDSDAVKKWEEHFHLEARDLFALRSIITTLRTPRNKVAHPGVNPAHAEQWKETLRMCCPPKVTDESIQHLIDIAVKKCCKN